MPTQHPRDDSHNVYALTISSEPGIERGAVFMRIK